MNAIPFDTLQFANRLKAVGFSEDQAQVLIDMQIMAAQSVISAIAEYAAKQKEQNQ